MDDSFKDLEAELKGLRLREPSAKLFARLDRDLAEEMPSEIAPPPRPRYSTATNLSSWKWFGWRAAGMAAAVALVATVSVVSLRKESPGLTANPTEFAASEAESVTPARTYASVPESRGVRYQPVAATNVLYDLKDEGYIQNEDDTAARRVRARYVDTYEWKNPKSNASLKWSVPRDEVRVIPASWN